MDCIYGSSENDRGSQHMVKKQRPELVFSTCLPSANCVFGIPHKRLIKAYRYRDDAICPISGGFPLKYAIHACESNMQGEFEARSSDVSCVLPQMGRTCLPRELGRCLLSSDGCPASAACAWSQVNEDQLYTQMEYEKIRLARYDG